jgi:hypothetical protein
MKISALDWRNLSAIFQDLADATLDYRVTNSATLTLDQKDSLNATFGQLLNYSESFADMALKQALSDIEVSVQNIQKSTHDAIDAVHAVNTLQRVLDITMAAVGVAAAMLAPTPGSIASSLSCLVQTVQQAHDS